MGKRQKIYPVCPLRRFFNQTIYSIARSFRSFASLVRRVSYRRLASRCFRRTTPTTGYNGLSQENWYVKAAFDSSQRHAVKSGRETRRRPLLHALVDLLY